MLLQLERRQLLRQRRVSQRHQAGVLLHGGGRLGGRLRDPRLPAPGTRYGGGLLGRRGKKEALKFRLFDSSCLPLMNPDDYDQLCPHGSGLLPRPVPATQNPGDQRAYIGTFSH